jgi:hypothetical protein
VSFDTSRYRFDPWKNYSGVVMEQGRVQLDSDWNEWLAQLNRRIQAGTLDTMGRAAYPSTTPFAFKISFDSSGKLVIGPGRMYVDGLLAENHGNPATVSWDPALAEMSNTPQPPTTTETGALAFVDQPWYSKLAPNATLPGSGSYLAYLDVWTRAVDYLQDPALVESAVAVDTTGRLQTVWQVGLAEVSAATTCGNSGSPWPAPSAGLLTVAPITTTPSGPCCLTNNTGYTGPENQHYRVEIHKKGPIGTATFKWSRDNASVETAVTGITAVTNSVLASASQLTVVSMGRDQVLGFRPGDWIEILDDELELAGLPGELHRIDTVDFAGRTITLDSPVSATSFPAPNNQTDPARHTRIRRWDQSGKVFQSDGTTLVADLGASGSAGDIPIPAAGTAILLEYGITVAFDLNAAGGEFNSGDFWTFAARTDGSLDLLTKAAPRGIHHHYIPLSVVDFSAGTATDCRVPWDHSCEDSCGCCTVTVGDGIESVGQYTSINAALAALPAQGGEVCILPGRYYEYVLVEQKYDVVIRGCGYHTRLASPTLLPPPPVETPRLHIASKVSAKATGGNEDGTFNAILSITASEHIQLRNFAVEASDNEIGVLIDGTAKLVVEPPAPTDPNNPEQTNQPRAAFARAVSPIVVDITVEDLFLTGSTLPAIFAQRVRLLHIDDNRILMKDVASLWPSVYVNGIEMHIDRNYVGIQSANNIREWLPANVASDLDSALQAGNALAQAEVKANPKISSKAAVKAIEEEKLKQIIDVSNISTTKIVVAQHMGGIQIAGPSKSVFVCENQIEGGRFNGITLGSYAIVDQGGIDTGHIIGIRTHYEDPCSTTGSLEPPNSSTTGVPGSSLVAGGVLIDIVIDRNRINSMGLCGIGPVGLFDLVRVFEIISIQNLIITNNIIRDTLLSSTTSLNAFGSDRSQDALVDPATGESVAGHVDASPSNNLLSVNSSASNPYGAICVPAVENLVIRDNFVINFGARPGLKANGIFVLNGEMVDISRNQILETRDWNATQMEGVTTSNSMHGGIILALVTPPVIPGSSYSTSTSVYTNEAAASYLSKPTYEPGMPALRVEENVVRIALGQSLVAVGFGPFAISNNHFSCGGMVRGGSNRPLAQTVLILNLGASIESAADAQFTGIYSSSKDNFAGSNPYAYNSYSVSSRRLATSQNGTVTFSNNICQLEARVDRQRSNSSLSIFSLDHVTFTGNHCWIDAAAPAAAGQTNITSIGVLIDALIAGGTVNVTGNRFQESPLSVFLSGMTIGIANITSQNIATFCLIIKAASAAFKVDSPNITLVSAVEPELCARLSALLK